METFKEYLQLILAVIFFIFFSYVFYTGMAHLFGKPDVKESSNLFYPQSGKLKIKVTNKYRNNEKFICEEQTLDDVVYAQLRLYPTIGCEKPTLFYLEDGSSEIKKIVVSEAELVK